MVLSRSSFQHSMLDTQFSAMPFEPTYVDRRNPGLHGFSCAAVLNFCEEASLECNALWKCKVLSERRCTAKCLCAQYVLLDLHLRHYNRMRGLKFTSAALTSA